MSEAELILAKLKIVSETEERGMYLCDKEHSKILLDYITNLQEENKELNDDNIWWNNRFKAVQRNYKDYKLRNEKAIEYLGIDEEILETCEIYDVNGIEVYKILKGENNE